MVRSVETGKIYTVAEPYNRATVYERRAKKVLDKFLDEATKPCGTWQVKMRGEGDWIGFKVR